MKEVVIDNKVYVQKSGVNLGGIDVGDEVITRTYSAGVFAGTLKSREGREVTLTDARRIWRWEGAASLSQLSVEGVKTPEDCKFPVKVPMVLLLEAIEILPLSKEAFESIDNVEIWEV